MALRSPRGATTTTPTKKRKKRISDMSQIGEEPQGSSQLNDRQAARAERRGGGNRSPRTPDDAGLPGGTTNAPPLTEMDMQRPSSAFGQQFKPASFPDLYTNPEVLAAAWMGQNGTSPQQGGGMYKVYSDLAQVMPQLFQLTQGGGGFDEAGFASFIDFANQFLNQYSTPGGGVISPSAVGNMFSAGDNSALGMMLNNPSLDPAQQSNLALGLIGGGLATSVPGALASAAMGNAEALAGQWMAQQAQSRPGQETTFTDFLRQNGFDQLFR